MSKSSKENMINNNDKVKTQHKTDSPLTANNGHKNNSELDTEKDGNKKNNNENNGYSIGIDLGTTYSCVGVYRNETVEIIANDMGNRTTPSYVSFGLERLIGESAKNECCENPKNTVFNAKRLIGRRFDDKEVQNSIKHLPFDLIKGPKEEPLIVVEHNGKKEQFTAEEISSMVLGKMKEIAETYLGCKIKNAIITVPAYFSDSQRQATMDAGKIAGLEVMRVLTEPTAAAIAYGLDRTKNKSSKIIVFDYGGGTLDVTLLSLDGGIFTVLAICGDTHLGGEDLDNKLVEYCVQIINNKHNIDVSTNIVAIGRLRSACEKAKRELSTQLKTKIQIATLFYDNKRELINFSTDISRAKFEELCSDDFEKCITPVENVLKDAKVSTNEISNVVLVGGSSRIPKIQTMLTSFFKNKNILCKTINPDEAVAYGAAVYAFMQNNEDEKTKDLLLIDATPLSLGVEVAGGAMSKIIERNTTIPTDSIKKIYSTSANNQSSVMISIYEGEREFIKDNRLLGKFEIRGITQAPRGVPKIEICFSINQNGILTVSGEDLKGNAKKHIVVNTNKGRLTESEIRKAIEQASKFKHEDELKRKNIESKNTLETYISSLRSSIKTINESDKSDNTKKLLKYINDTAGWFENNSNLKTQEYDDKYKELELKFRDILLKYTDTNIKSNKKSHDGNDTEDGSSVVNITINNNKTSLAKNNISTASYIHTPTNIRNLIQKYLGYKIFNDKTLNIYG